MYTGTMVQRMADVCMRTWNAVGDDFLSLFRSRTCSRMAVAEAVLDADRYETYGRDAEAIAEIRKRLDKCGLNLKKGSPVSEFFDLAFSRDQKRWG